MKPWRKRAVMGWIHDTGYDAAYDHEGYPASVLADGSDTERWSQLLAPQIVGWRAACSCGWRCSFLYARSEWPSRNGDAPEAVDGWESGSGCYREWETHLNEAVPELAVYDLGVRIRELKDQLDDAVKRARRRGVSWETIGRAYGVTGNAARERWRGQQKSLRSTS
jgi:hypothetical protein